MTEPVVKVLMLKGEKGDGVAELEKSLNARLASARFVPKSFQNSDAIKSTYPAGADGIYIAADTGHMWLYVGGNWVDGGQYQTPAPIDDIRKAGEAVDQLKKFFYNLTDEQKQQNRAIASVADQATAYAAALDLKDVFLKDESGANLTDQNGNKLLAKQWLPRTDTVGGQSGIPIDSTLVGDTFLSNLTKYGLPVLYLDDERIFSLKDKSKKLKSVPYHWVNAPGTMRKSGILDQIKVQGNSSVSFPKKSYTLKFDVEGAAKSGWVNSDKYVIKADWTDFSHLRNLGVSKLYSQMRQERIEADDHIVINGGNLADQSGNLLAVETDPSLSTGINYGTIDGFPIFVVIDGVYNGLYNLIIPKGKEMAKMPDRAKRAVVSAEGGNISGFLAPPALDKKGNLDAGNGWDIEFVPDEDDQKWVADAMINLYSIISAHYDSDQDFINAVSPYLDIDSAIDLWLLALATDSTDERDHNFLLQTFDGKKWYVVTYDNDITFGIQNWQGDLLHSASGGYMSNTLLDQTQRLWHQIVKHCTNRVIDRWEMLRHERGILSELNIWYVFNTLGMRIPRGAYEAESKRWPAMPGTSIKTVEQITTFYNMSIKLIDEEINNLK